MDMVNFVEVESLEDFYEMEIDPKTFYIVPEEDDEAPMDIID